ncbi:hypothetical protein E8E11_001836 [Didymella keratinophila]|nr:hypothetical protein E8E11_001836 [Didymella keratinophila]
MSPTQPFETIVFVDIPDPDNILMILYVLAVSKGRVAIVLSPRIVDLSVVRYGKEFSAMNKDLGFKVMFDPITEGEEPEVPDEWKKFFQPDGTLSDPKVNKDTRLYVRVSKQRIEECIEEQFPGRKDYEIFWDPKSMENIKKPDMRHALHVADYAFNFNDNEREKYTQIVREYTKSGSRLRRGLRGICDEYIARQRAERDSSLEPTDIQKLFQANMTVEKAKLIIGGPLTEALLYIKHTKGKLVGVYVMMGTLTNDRNMREGVQFNVGKDPESANEFLNKIMTDWIRTLLVPTECCKGKDEENPCPYALDPKGYQDLLESKSPLLYKMVGLWMQETGQKASYNPFDWITAIAAEKETIFKRWVPVTHKPCQSGKGVTNVVFARTQRPSPIFMAKPNYEYMSNKTKEVRNEMKKTFPIRNKPTH